MLLKLANDLCREGKFHEALLAYRQIPSSDPLYHQAEFNIRFIEQKLDGSLRGFIVSPNIQSTQYTPLISIIMPVFNVASYLDASIMSVLNQTYHNFELIIIDDGSTDHSQDIINMYKQRDNRIKIIELPVNTIGGVGIASNIGIEHAMGEYVAFIDGDDILMQSAIEKMVDAAVCHDIDIVIGDFYTFDDNSRVMQPAYDKQKWQDIPLNQPLCPIKYPTVLGLSPVPWRKLYKTAFLQKNNLRFLEGDYLYEDNPFHWVTLLTAKNVLLIDQTIAYHRMNRDGQTMKASLYKLTAKFIHMNTVINFVKSMMPLNTSPTITIWIEVVKRIAELDWSYKRHENPQIYDLIERRKALVLKKAFEESNLSLKGFMDSYSEYHKIPELLSYEENTQLSIVCSLNSAENMTHSVIEEKLQKLLQLREISTQIILIHDDKSVEVCTMCQRLIAQYQNVSVITHMSHSMGCWRNAAIPLLVGRYTLFYDIANNLFDEGLVDAIAFANTNNCGINFFKKNPFNAKANLYQDEAKTRHDKRVLNSSTAIKLLRSDLVNDSLGCIIKTDFLHDQNIFFGNTKKFTESIFYWNSILSADSIDGYSIGWYSETVVQGNKNTAGIDNTEQQVTIHDINDTFEMFRHMQHMLSKHHNFEPYRDELIQFIDQFLEKYEQTVANPLLPVYYQKRQALHHQLETLYVKSDATIFSKKRVAFYRVIDDDMLHDFDQLINRVKYIIETESSHENVTKIFLLRDLADIEKKSQLIAMLESYTSDYADLDFIDMSLNALSLNTVSHDDNGSKISTLANDPDNPDNMVSLMADVEKQKSKTRTNSELAHLYNVHNLSDVIVDVLNPTIPASAHDSYDWIMVWHGCCFLPRKHFRRLLTKMNESSQVNYLLTPAEVLLTDGPFDDTVSGANFESQISIRTQAMNSVDDRHHLLTSDHSHSFSVVARTYVLPLSVIH